MVVRPYSFVKPVLSFLFSYDLKPIEYHLDLARGTLAKFGPEAFGDEQSSIGVGQFMQINKKWWRISWTRLLAPPLTSIR